MATESVLWVPLAFVSHFQSLASPRPQNKARKRRCGTQRWPTVQLQHPPGPHPTWTLSPGAGLSTSKTHSFAFRKACPGPLRGWPEAVACGVRWSSGGWTGEGSRQDPGGSLGPHAAHPRDDAYFPPWPLSLRPETGWQSPWLTAPRVNLSYSRRSPGGQTAVLSGPGTLADEGPREAPTAPELSPCGPWLGPSTLASEDVPSGS